MKDQNWLLAVRHFRFRYSGKRYSSKPSSFCVEQFSQWLWKISAELYSAYSCWLVCCCFCKIHVRDFIASTSRGAIKYVFRLGFFVVAVAVAAAVFHIQASCIFFCFHQHSPLNVSSFRTNSKLSSLPACTRVFFSPFSRGQTALTNTHWWICCRRSYTMCAQCMREDMDKQ